MSDDEVVEQLDRRIDCPVEWCAGSVATRTAATARTPTTGCTRPSTASSCRTAPACTGHASAPAATNGPSPMQGEGAGLQRRGLPPIRSTSRGCCAASRTRSVVGNVTDRAEEGHTRPAVARERVDCSGAVIR